jgi:hypothetical protein
VHAAAIDAYFAPLEDGELPLGTRGEMQAVR